MEPTTQISEAMLEALIAKYKADFETRFRPLQLSVHFTSNGQPPTPEEIRTTPETIEGAGSFVKVGRDYRIGIKQNLSVEARLLAFFHEYGHAVYRRQASELIDNKEAKIRTETAALRTSLELAEKEGLSQIAFLAVHNARQHALLYEGEYQAAMDNARDNPLWLKYSNNPNG
jgi:hypothetical protein